MHNTGKRSLSALAIVVALFLAVISFFMPDGKAIFSQERCITCHLFKGEGGMAGPDLTNVSTRRGSIWIMRQIKNPRSHNPGSRMPSYEHLSYAEIYAVIRYLQS